MGILPPAWALLLLTSPCAVTHPLTRTRSRGTALHPHSGAGELVHHRLPRIPQEGYVHARVCTHRHGHGHAHTTFTHTHSHSHIQHISFPPTHTPRHIYTHSPHTWTTYDTHTDNIHTHIHTTCTYTHVCAPESSALIRVLLPGHPGGWELLA